MLAWQTAVDGPGASSAAAILPQLGSPAAEAPALPGSAQRSSPGTPAALELPVTIGGVGAGGTQPAAPAAPPAANVPASEGGAGTAAFATQAALLLTEGNETQAQEVADAAAQAFAAGQPEAVVGLAQATAASMAFGPSQAINLVVLDSLAFGGEFASFFASSLAQASANLVDAAGATAAAVPYAFAEASCGDARGDEEAPMSRAACNRVAHKCSML